ncbi:dna-binding protein smubp-2 [Lunatimonas lonarensis]|uniref:Dna-binding protein smubp-2 n=1 Tax=Lunatimonas lonarensis TaxID=1232681 RepID=R7ZU90_9BACT|nr:AAA domain-containing protein [Lunatimonas lonarensis]EON77598.1 dna-binding protein smubp-2 [Lunatimonas lonarensis]
MANIQEELLNTKNLLKAEWKEDLEQYKSKTRGKSIAERIDAGTCLYPLQIQRVRTGLADKIMVEVRQLGSRHGHGFQSGKSVCFFCNSGEGDSAKNSINGVVNFVKGDTMMMTLHVEEMPAWLYEGKLGVDLLFDESTYRQMESALNRISRAESGRLAELKQVLLGAQPGKFEQESPMEPYPSDLNEGQLEAIRLVVQARDVAVIHGPPGTGKTTTLVAAVKEVLKRHVQVLVCAPSNAAVDLLVEKLSTTGIETVRIGHPARVDDQIIDQTMDAKVGQHPAYRDLKRLKKSHADLKRQAGKYKRNYGVRERSQKQQLFDEARRVWDEIGLLEDYIRFGVLQQARVIATTLTGASSAVLKGMHFPVVFIDEAAQGLEPATWIPVLVSDKVVMAGDHCQLPPTIKSSEAAKRGLRETLFEKVILRQPKVSQMLWMQYRMPEVIMGFSSRYFYEDRLLAAPNTAFHRLGEEPILTFIDTAGSGYTEFTDKETLSTRNNEEARFILQLLTDLVKRLGTKVFVQEGRDIGLISPYRAQVEYLKELVAGDDAFLVLRSLQSQLTIDTIDGFQGQERDLVLISLVRSNAGGEIGFLSDVRRMNVALTRAKRQLIVVGDSSTLASHPFYERFFDYIDEKECYSSVYEWIES